MRPDARNFVERETEFRLGALLTEQFHPVTAHLSGVARENPSAGLRLLYTVDRDLPPMLRRSAVVDAAHRLARQMADTLKRGGRIFFTGCGATGRLAILLDVAWRRFWRERGDDPSSLEGRVTSVMAGGDYALIKSVEGYEDYQAFGRRQMKDAGLAAGDLVCAVTEGGETSFVIGTVWAGVEAGATVWFIYNNPDDVLSGVKRSHEVIKDKRVFKACLATGPMAISGSTRMQATSAELAFVGSALEAALAEVLAWRGMSSHGVDPDAPEAMAGRVTALTDALLREDNLLAATRLVVAERGVYQRGGLMTYMADRYALDLLTDTTERSPTFLVPPFVKRGDDGAASWSYFVMPCSGSAAAWRRLLQRDFNDVAWTPADIAAMVGDSAPPTTPCLDRNEILRFDISSAGAEGRLRDERDVLALFQVGEELQGGGDPRAAESAIERATECRAQTLVVRFGLAAQLSPSPSIGAETLSFTLPPWPGLLNLGEHLGVKMVMNAVSSLTMTLMGRVLGNSMIWMSPSNKKLYDRATRYVTQITGASYAESCDAIFGVMERVRPRMADGRQAAAPVLLAAVALLAGVSAEQAETLLADAVRRGESPDALIVRLRQDERPRDTHDL